MSFLGGIGMEKMGREEIVAMYKPDVERLLPYLSWLRDKSGADVTQSYEDNSISCV